MEKQLNFVNNLNNRVRKRYYIDDNSEFDLVPREENNQVYSINNNQLFQMEVADEEEEISSDIVSFMGRQKTKIEKLQINIEPVQSGSGDPSPENVRPISGWDAVGVSVANANLIAEYSEHPLAVSGSEYIYYYTVGTSVLFRCKEGVAYYLHRGEGATRNIWAFYREKPVPGRAGVGSVSEAHAASSVGPVVAPLTGWCVIFVRQSEYNEDIAKGTQVSLFPPTDVSLPDTTDMTVDLPQTVYGGTLDVTSGEMLITMVMVSPESVDDTAKSSDGSGDRYGIVRVGPMGYIKTDGNQICNMLKHADVLIGKMPAGFFKVINSTGANESRAAFHFAGLTTTAAYNEKLQQLKSANTPLQICFELEEPIEIQLTPTEITSLIGQNTVWSDAGPITLKYSTKGLTTYLLKP